MRLVHDDGSGSQKPTLPPTVNLYLAPHGPSLDYGGGALFISDLSPHVETQWPMNRWELFKMGCSCIGASLEPRRDLPQSQDLPRFVIAMAMIGIIAGAIGFLFAHFGTPRGLD